MPDAPPITVGASAQRQRRRPEGLKGVAEPPSVPTPAAVANAISKVTGRPLRQMPMTPDRVWAHEPEPDA